MKEGNGFALVVGFCAYAACVIGWELAQGTWPVELWVSFSLCVLSGVYLLDQGCRRIPRRMQAIVELISALMFCIVWVFVKIFEVLLICFAGCLISGWLLQRDKQRL